MDTTQETGRRSPTTSEVLEGLNDLLQLDHDAVGAYDIAIEKLEDPDHARQIAGFRKDHERHIRDLNAVITELGGTPVNKPHATGPFKEALQSLGGLAGDKGVLLAWRTNELQVRTKYDSYASEAGRWPSEIKRLIDENALDEERHYSWVVKVLQGMGVGPGEGVETDVATRLREAGAQVENLGYRARREAESLEATTRNRLADGLESAAHRLEQFAERPSGDSGPPEQVREATHRVADGMESTAAYLRTTDVRGIRDDLEDAARRKPLRTLAILFAAGFVTGRILR